MAEYQATDIFSLEDHRPEKTETKSLGDDAIREIKKVLKTCFPNSDSGDTYEGTLSQLTDLAINNTIPRDTVVAWSPANLLGLPEGPLGWTICDGRARRTGGGFAPDLRSQLIIGAGDLDETDPLVPALNHRGGFRETDIRDLYTGDPIEFQTQGHKLLTSELPSHEHKMFVNETSVSKPVPGGGDAVALGGSVGGANNYVMQESSSPTSDKPVNGRTSTAGTNVAHTHTFTIEDQGGVTGSNVPSFHALIFIIKD